MSAILKGAFVLTLSLRAVEAFTERCGGISARAVDPERGEVLSLVDGFWQPLTKRLSHGWCQACCEAEATAAPS
jgi:hypothetical protein